MFKKILISITIFAVSGFSLTVDEVLDKMEENENSQTSRIEITQTIISSSGRESVSKMISWSMDKGDKSISEYVSPARIKGMKILMLNDGDDIWFYSPRTARARKIASHQKNQSVNGSDFSYEDMSTKDRRDEYDCALTGEEKIQGKACYKIDMKAKDPKKSYQKMTFWVDKASFVPLEGHMFDEAGELWKKLFMTGVKKSGKYWSADKIEMQNVIKGSKTVMHIDKEEYDLEVDANMFTERYLKQ